MKFPAPRVFLRFVLLLGPVEVSFGQLAGLTFTAQTPPLEAPHAPAFDLRDEVTVEGWIKLPEKDFRNMRILDKAQGYGISGYYLGLGGNDRDPELAWGTSRGELRVNPRERKIPVGKWIHVAGVFSVPQKISKLYVDGVV